MIHGLQLGVHQYRNIGYRSGAFDLFTVQPTNPPTGGVTYLKPLNVYCERLTPPPPSKVSV